MNNIPVLDKGFVQLVDQMGDDRRVVNAARVSYGQDKEESTKLVLKEVGSEQEETIYTGQVLTDKDKTLIKYMMNNNHSSPFEHVVFTFIIKCPLFVRSQIMRHRTFSYNEISRRYTSDNIEFYIPLELRKQAEDNKQASINDTTKEIDFAGIADIEKFILSTRETIETSTDQALMFYNTLLDNGIAREQARMVLPQNLYTKFYMTGNLHNWFHFLELRCSEHAQYETRLFANTIRDIIERCVPVSFNAWKNKYGL